MATTSYSYKLVSLMLKLDFLKDLKDQIQVKNSAK